MTKKKSETIKVNPSKPTAKIGKSKIEEPVITEEKVTEPIIETPTVVIRKLYGKEIIDTIDLNVYGVQVKDVTTIDGSTYRMSVKEFEDTVL
jgi:hypothetical protein